MNIRIRPSTGGFSDFLLILIIHRQTKCLFEISTDVGIETNTEIKKHDGFCKRLDAKIMFLFDKSPGKLRS